MFISTATIADSVKSLMFLYRVQTQLWMSVCMNVTYISSLRFDVRKKIISAFARVIPLQEFCAIDFLIF